MQRLFLQHKNGLMPGGRFLRRAVVGRQDAEFSGRLGDQAVELAFIVKARNDVVLQILVRALFQLPAQGQIGRRRAAVQPARHVKLPAAVRDGRPAFAAAVIGVENRIFAIVGQVADRRQALPGGGVGQQLVGADDAGAVQVGVGKEQVVIALQRVGLAEEGVKSAASCSAARAGPSDKCGARRGASS